METMTLQQALVRAAGHDRAGELADAQSLTGRPRPQLDRPPRDLGIWFFTSRFKSHGSMLRRAL
ncbi:MAG TPA: hypothetical protein VK797_25660 [Tepidisphaeraceae bacterium]|jgi:hypothetical protein|nr:hypothetical protein [Tepidisphaeraceae bacterium]